jgi:hypothetical protein
MTLTEENKRDIIEAFIETFTRFSDKDYQRRIWVKGEGPECDDFTETICQLYDIGYPILEDYKNFGITNSQYQLLKQFLNELDVFRYGPIRRNHLPQEFIESPEWETITKLAQEVLIAFNYQKDSRSFS